MAIADSGLDFGWFTYVGMLYVSRGLIKPKIGRLGRMDGFREHDALREFLSFLKLGIYGVLLASRMHRRTFYAQVSFQGCCCE